MFSLHDLGEFII